MKEYKALTEEEVGKYKAMLKLPNIDFPHYEHLRIDGKTVYQYTGIELLTKEIFAENEYFRDNYNLKLEISNYGRLKINDEFIIPTVGGGTFKHGLIVYINNDWPKKSIHRLVKETFEPIIGMEQYEVHHINNNGNDNRLENLIWISKNDHRKIDNEFNIKLMEIANIINSSKPHCA
jgi:hypothetical protein